MQINFAKILDVLKFNRKKIINENLLLDVHLFPKQALNKLLYKKEKTFQCKTVLAQYFLILNLYLVLLFFKAKSIEWFEESKDLNTS